MQRAEPLALLKMSFTGFHAADPEVGRMLDGGGVFSMLKVAGIVCLSSSYSGIFQKTGLLDGMKRAVDALARRTTPFAAMLCTSALTGMVACNQTLTIMLTSQLCGGSELDGADFANDLEDTAVILAPLVPWSIAGGVPLAAVGAPVSALLLACYLYLLPLWRLAVSLRQKRRAPSAG